MNTAVAAQQVIDRLNWRYATKKFDPQQDIPEERLQLLEQALVLSASSAGMQPWKFIVIRDQALRQKLQAASYGQAQIVDAARLVVFAARTDVTEADVDAHLKRTAEVRGVSLESLASFRGMLVGGLVASRDQPARRAWAARQAYIALGTLLTSAAMMGIDACPMEGFVPEQYDAILDLDQKGYSAVVICALGQRAPDDVYAGLPKVRFPASELIVHL